MRSSLGICGTRLVLVVAVLCTVGGCGRRESDDKPTPVQPGGSQPAGGKAIAGPLTEQQKITALLDSIVAAKATFIRNDVEYPAWAARQFMDAKLQKAGDTIQSAGDFIEQVATRSSTSGRAYQIKFADGQTTDSAFWLRARLAEIESSRR